MAMYVLQMLDDDTTGICCFDLIALALEKVKSCVVQ